MVIVFGVDQNQQENAEKEKKKIAKELAEMELELYERKHHIGYPPGSWSVK